MTYIVKDECIKCKLMDCVEVCPVDCFYEGENMLVINPDECIDCGVCEPECPIDAIKPDTDETPDKDKWVELNKKYSAIWPNISKKKEPMVDHEKFKNVKNKLEEHFSEQLCDTVIPRNVKLAEAPSFGMPALYYEPEAKGTLAYLALAGEIINKFESNTNIY